MSMSKLDARTATAPDRWLLLVHQIPAKPAYLRVKVWRRLQSIGAVAIKNAVYALPASEQAQEDFAWLLREIADGGGEAMICEARLVDGLADEEVHGMFNAARDQDYDALAKEARALAAGLRRKAAPQQRAEARSQLARLRTRQAQIVALDFFGANGRETADGLLAGLEEALREDARAEPVAVEAAADALSDLKGHVWVTRHGVHIDRIACAWLVRRFIDAGARFKFVPPRGYVPSAGELRFDMFQAEFTHEGDRCSFEVLLARAGLRDPALQAIAEIIHDIDLKDGKFGREECPGMKSLIAGIAMAHKDDEARIAAGTTILDNLHAYFRKKRG
jgi:hypothetical protein